MNPDSPQTPRDEMEQRLTALLLGELSAGESAALHRAMEQDGELAKLFARLHHTVGLVRETVTSPSEPTTAQATPTKLSNVRREKLLAHFKTVVSKEFAPEKPRPRVRLLELAAVLAICAVLAAMLMPAMSSSKAKSQLAAIQSNVRQIEVAKQLWVEENQKPVGAVASMEDLKPYLGREMPSVGGEAYVVGRVGEPVVARVEKNGVAREVKSTAQPNALTIRTATPALQSERAIDSGLRTMGASEGREPASYFDNPGVASVEFGATKPVSDGLVKRPVGLTPLPAKLSTPVALPQTPPPAVNLYADDGVDHSGGPKNFGDTTVGTTFHRDGPVFLGGGAGGGGNASQLSGRQPIADNEAQSRRAVTEDTLMIVGGVVSDTGGKAESLRRGFSAGQREEAFVPPPIAASSEPALTVNGGGLGLPAQETVGLSSVRANADRFAANGRTTPATPPVTMNYWAMPQASARTGVTRDGDADGNGIAGLPVITATNYLAFENRDELALTDDFNRSKQLDKAQPQEVKLRARFAEVKQKDNKALGFDSYLGNIISGNKIPQDKAQEKNELGRRLGGIELPMNTPVSDDGRIAPEPEVYSLDMVEYTNGAHKSEVIPGLASAPRTLRQSESSTILQITSAVEPRKSLESAPANQKLAYADKQRELQELTDFNRLLKRKMNIEKTDLSLPRSSQVEIVEQAVPDFAPTTSWFGKVRGALGGEVERTATVSIIVEKDKTDIAEISGKSLRSAPYDPYFVYTDSEVVQSDAVLGKVVDQLKLDEAWANGKGKGAKLKKNEAVALLRKRLEVNQRPNTTVVDIQAKSVKPEEAARIANAVAQAYKTWRFERGQRMVTAGITELEKQVVLQDKKVKQAEMELDRLRRELKISDEDVVAEIASATVRKPSTNAPVPQPEIQTRENNFSTFSLNVSDVSFKLAAASLEKGQMPDVASIRSEEFINAFDYRDPERAAGAPIAFAYERARYPFAHNRDLLRFSLKTAAAGRQAGRPMNIVVLLDNSGSMERADRVRIIREALRVLAGQMQPQDKLSVITFARTARLVADGVSGDKAGEVAEQVSGVTPQGGTNLEGAMNLAYQTAARHYLANGINRVVLLTDGAANLGDVEPESLQQKVEAQRKQGIAMDCFGIGWEGLNDDLLEVLSRNGDGRYGFINSPEEAASDFVGQLAGALKVAASDVKVQVEFNPKRVTTYRQIGYAKHQLTKEQFRDNTVDAAEIAAQEAGNALYTVEVNPTGEGALCTVRVRYKIPSTTDYREQAWDVPFTGNALSLEQSSPAMRLAASASAFAEWLVASAFAGEVTTDALLNQLRGVPEVFGADARPKKLEWMIRQAKSLEGK